MKKGSKCGPGCNCKNCNNMTTDLGAQQPSNTELDELEQEEVLHDEDMWREHGEQCVYDSEDDMLEDEERRGGYRSLGKRAKELVLYSEEDY